MAIRRPLFCVSRMREHRYPPEPSGGNATDDTLNTTNMVNKRLTKAFRNLP